MLYYKLGDKELKPWIAEASRKWAEFGATRPVARKLLVAGVCIVVFFTIAGGLGSNYGPDYVDPKAYLAAAKNAVNH